MKAARFWALAGSVGLAVSFTAGMAGQAVAKPVPSRVMLRGSLTPASERSHPAGKVSAKSAVSFDLLLKLRNAAGAKAFVRAVSSPGSKSFHKYLTEAQWIARFGPTKAEISNAEVLAAQPGLLRGVGSQDSPLRECAWIGGQGRAHVRRSARHVQGHGSQGPARQVRAVDPEGGVQLCRRRRRREPGAGDDHLAFKGRSTAAVKPDQEPGPPAGFRNPQPCTAGVQHDGGHH